MKLWIDAQLSPAIAAWINRTFEDIDAESVRALVFVMQQILRYLKRQRKRMQLS